MASAFLEWIDKDPDDVLDYGLDWTSRLGTDTIASSTWIVPSGITGGVESNTSKITTIWLSGGTNGTKYRLTNRIVTAADRTIDQSVTLQVRTK